MNELPTHLRSLGLHATAASLDDLLARATQQRLSPRDLLEALVQGEMLERSRRSLERRMLRSRIGSFKPMADFDWNWPKKIDRPLIERALALDFLREGRNLVLIGSNGVGKTMIAKNVAHAAILAGFSVVFRTATDLIDDLSCDSPERRRRRVAAYSRPHLLCIDSCGVPGYVEQGASEGHRGRKCVGPTPHNQEQPGDGHSASSHSRTEASARHAEGARFVSPIGPAFATAARLVSRSTMA